MTIFLDTNSRIQVPIFIGRGAPFYAKTLSHSRKAQLARLRVVGA